MSMRQVFQPKRPRAAAAAAVFTLTGVGFCVFRSCFTRNVFAESVEPPSVFSGTFGTSLRLESAESVNHNTKRLRFEFPQPNARSGLVLTSSVLIVMWPKGRLLPVLRPYTPVTPTDQRGFLDLMVKKYPAGTGSTYLHAMTPGESLYFLTTLKGYRWSPNKYPHVMLIAGGAGITPMYQLIQGILRNPKDSTKVTLVFGVNSDADILLQKEFKELEQQFPDRFKAVYTVSSPIEGSPHRKGYVTEALLKEVTVGTQGKNTKVFVCGPPAMEAALLGGKGPFKSNQAGILERLGYGKDQVYKF